MTEFNENVVFNKIMNHEALTEDEVKTLIWDYEVDYEEGDSGRWTRGMTTIVELNGHYFSINWQAGLTEYQENEYFDFYPTEVELVEQVVKVTNWMPIMKKKND